VRGTRWWWAGTGIVSDKWCAVRYEVCGAVGGLLGLQTRLLPWGGSVALGGLGAGGHTMQNRTQKGEGRERGVEINTKDDICARGSAEAQLGGRFGD
jgi:hypothetical protein